MLSMLLSRARVRSEFVIMQHVPEMVPMESWCQLFFRKFHVTAMPGLLEVMTKGNGNYAMLGT